MTCHSVVMMPYPVCSITGKEVDRHTERWDGRQWEKDERKRMATLERRGRSEWWLNMFYVGVACLAVAILSIMIF